jgi:hypothetical protein
MCLQKRLGVAAKPGDLAERVPLSQPVQRTLQRPSRLRRVQRPRLYRKHPAPAPPGLPRPPRAIGTALPARSCSGDQLELVRGERQDVTVAVQPNLDALDPDGPPVPDRHDSAAATGDLTGAFPHPHPRLPTIAHRGRQLPDLGVGQASADYQPGQRFHVRGPLTPAHLGNMAMVANQQPARPHRHGKTAFRSWNVPISS